jgi:hypothetical protein
MMRVERCEIYTIDDNSERSIILDSVLVLDQKPKFRYE